MTDQKPDDLAGRLEHPADAAEKDGFLCPGCGGIWFGTRFYGQPNQERYCKTPEAPGCGWHGPETEARPGNASVPVTDLREAARRLRNEPGVVEALRDALKPFAEHGDMLEGCDPTDLWCEAEKDGRVHWLAVEHFHKAFAALTHSAEEGDDS